MPLEGMKVFSRSTGDKAGIPNTLRGRTGSDSATDASSGVRIAPRDAMFRAWLRVIVFVAICEMLMRRVISAARTTGTA
jgi:hypothetical protein